MPAARKRRIKAILTAITFIALVGLLIGLRSQIYGTVIGLKNANAFALSFILVWQALNFHSQTKMYQSFFTILGSSAEYKPMLRTMLELNFVNAVFPSGGVSGFSYFGVKMKNLGISAGKATLVQMMRFIALFISFLMFLFIGLLLLAFGGGVSNLTILVAASLTTLITITTIGLVFVVGSKRRIDAFFTFIARILNKIIHIVRPKHPETINVATVRELFWELHDNYMILRKDLRQLGTPLKYAFLANLGEMLTIYSVFVAFGQLVNPGAIIIAYAVANFAGIISVLPGGIGVYEALMTGVLATAGVSPAVSLPAIITYRVLNFSLQLPIGYTLYYRTIHPKED